MHFNETETVNDLPDAQAIRRDAMSNSHKRNSSTASNDHLLGHITCLHWQTYAEVRRIEIPEKMANRGHRWEAFTCTHIYRPWSVQAPRGSERTPHHDPPRIWTPRRRQLLCASNVRWWSKHEYCRDSSTNPAQSQKGDILWGLTSATGAPSNLCAIATTYIKTTKANTL